MTIEKPTAFLKFPGGLKKGKFCFSFSGNYQNGQKRTIAKQANEKKRNDAVIIRRVFIFCDQIVKTHGLNPLDLARHHPVGIDLEALAKLKSKAFNITYAL